MPATHTLTLASAKKCPKLCREYTRQQVYRGKMSRMELQLVRDSIYRTSWIVESAWSFPNSTEHSAGFIGGNSRKRRSSNSGHL